MKNNYFLVGFFLLITTASGVVASELVSRPLNNWSSLYAMILFIFLC